MLSPEYGRDVTIRKVRTNGQIKWKGHMVYLSEALKGEPVGLVQLGEGTWTASWPGLYHRPNLDEHIVSALHTPTKLPTPVSPV